MRFKQVEMAGWRRLLGSGVLWQVRRRWRGYVTSGGMFVADRVAERRAQFLNIFSLVGSVTLVVLGLLNLGVGQVVTGLVELVCGGVMVGNVVWLRWRGVFTVAAAVMLAALAAPLLVVLVTGGLAGTGIYWYPVFPVVAFLLVGRQRGLGWLAVLTVAVVGLGVLAWWVEGMLAYEPLQIRQMLVSVWVTAAVVYFFDSIVAHSRELATRRASSLRQEMDETDTIVRERTRELKEMQNRMAASIDNLPLGFVATNEQDEVMMTNRKLNQLFSYDVNRSVAQCLEEDLQLADLVRRCRETASPVEVSAIEMGSSILRVLVAPVVSGDSVTGTIVLVEDITERQLAERSREEFFAVASHELRTPLTAIRGNMALVQDFFAEVLSTHEDLEEMIQDAHVSSVRLIGIVNDFLDVSRLEQGRVELAMEQFDMVAVVSDVVDEMQELARERGLGLVWRPPMEGKKVRAVETKGDVKRVRQVLVNLVGNALKFTDAGTVTLVVAADTKEVRVQVQDTGVGISPRNQRRLFKKFQQAGERILARDVTQGTGMGLYISKLLIEGMGGRIELVESEVGKGSVFEFALRR